MTAPSKRRLTQKRLKELLTYHAETGVFVWNVVRGGKRPGDVAGSVCRARGKDYIRIRLDDELIMAHRLVWLYVHGTWPDDELDHEDGDGLNNRLLNLQPANRVQNNTNASLRKDNWTGTPGVHQVRNGNWVAVAGKGGIHRFGTHPTKEAAVAARKRGEEQLDYHPTHGKPKVRP